MYQQLHNKPIDFEKPIIKMLWKPIVTTRKPVVWMIKHNLQFELLDLNITILNYCNGLLKNLLQSENNNFFLLLLINYSFTNT